MLQDFQGENRMIDKKKPAHVLVFGNEKGGSGKSTLAQHVLVALLRQGKRVGSLDLDIRQKTLTHFLNNRRKWAGRENMALLTSRHLTIKASTSVNRQQQEEEDFTSFARAVGQLEYDYDYLIIDTPGHDGFLCRLGHAMADTLVTPVNDSFVDLDVLGQFDTESGLLVRENQYTDMVRESRLRRYEADGGAIDWIVVRNRLSMLDANNKKRVEQALHSNEASLDYRQVTGLAERVIYRELFQSGMTILDVLAQDTPVQATMSHLAARQEIRHLVQSLKLPERSVPTTAPRSTAMAPGLALHNAETVFPSPAP
jgi:chromosome partitioning protein